jgi:hypothetical protein
VVAADEMRGEVVLGLPRARMSIGEGTVGAVGQGRHDLRIMRERIGGAVDKQTEVMFDLWSRARSSSVPAGL